MVAMADPKSKWSENVPGPFYVDEACIASDFCISAAPDHFRMDDSGHAYVYRQPKTPEEYQRCLEALSGCPVNAIGDNGDENK
jgi:ferredoxin